MRSSLGWCDLRSGHGQSSLWNSQCDQCIRNGVANGTAEVISTAFGEAAKVAGKMTMTMDEETAKVTCETARAVVRIASATEESFSMDSVLYSMGKKLPTIFNSQTQSCLCIAEPE